ncbi:Arylamine N-acetyltransferase [Lecanosticta acicola]|uniref:Arylamine N-acetyltransferase n=1 Tax=Lecanosticta acicola TaxID=111012 RepID=A0AAI9E8G1_9PEZI|nr:Arylamine N-acetyltransferase [Lecanosticta acicola]
MAHNAPPTQMTQLPVKPEDRPRYSKEQLQTYFHRIHLPKHHLASPVLKNDPSLASTQEHGLPLLRALHLYHLGNIPFENLELHYSAHKKISLNMDDLYTKFAERGLQYGRGGRCMENNGFFGTVLRSIGYDVRNCAGRVSRSWSPDAETRKQQGETYDCWNHMLNLVRIEEQWWVVDVGMGSMGPSIIYPLQDGWEGVAIPPRVIRLQKRSIPETYSRTSEDATKLWCYDVCHRPDESERKWIPTYCFTETEFLPQDYEMMSWFTSTHPKSFFTYSVLCTRLILDEEQQCIVGDISLFNDGVMKKIGGKKGEERQLKTEEERVRVLKEMLGVELTEEEKSGMPLERKLT